MSAPPTTASPPDPSHLRRRLLADRLATGLITAGGFSLVLSILVIFLFLARESWPLLMGARLDAPTATLPAASPLAVGTDAYQDIVWSVDGHGRVTVLSADGQPVQDLQLPLDSLETPLLIAGEGGGRLDHIALATSAGRLLQVNFEVRREEGGQGRTSRIEPEGLPVVLPGDSLLAPMDGRFRHLAMARGEGRTIWAWVEDDGLRIVLNDEDEGETLFGRWPMDDAGTVRGLALAPGAELLALALAGDELAVYEVSDPSDLRLQTRGPSGLQDIRALTFLTGAGSLVAGDAHGRMVLWQSLADGESGRRWAQGHALPSHPGAITRLTPSPRERSFLSLDASGLLRLQYATSGRLLAEHRVDPGRGELAVFSPRADGLLLAGARGIERRVLHNPHGDVSLEGLLAPVQYEGYPEPAWIWQSTGGSDDFEPKYSFVPLVFGTLKGTLFALLISVPLALLAAIYVSHFAPAALARTIKPAIEIMAALPSVIIGFLAGLVFAPYLESHLSSLMVFPLLLVLLLVACIPVWRRMPAGLMDHAGAQLGFGSLLIVAALLAGYTLGPALEALVFDGSLVAWLNSRLGLVYDQRNSLVVGFALGFAVIPIIFTMSEDALSNVPDSQVSASLALGASRWYTVRHVVLPGAAAGVFAAVMIGLGRAIGETMIVLMATGNTPLLDISPFNGFRTMSACIAVEIPEAPVGGSLYRLLFAVALLLFVFTFLINTAASLISERLRKRQGRL
jgi:phosphate transport system permease protein